MQWDDSPNAGFTTPEVTPWLPLADDYRQRNVAAQEDDAASMLSLFRALTALRRAEPALNRGEYEGVELGMPDVLAYRRTAAGSDGYLIVLNFGNTEQRLSLSELDSLAGQLVLSTDSGRAAVAVQGTFALAPNEGAIIRLE